MLAFRIFFHALRQLVHETAAISRMAWAPVLLHVLAVYGLFDSAERQMLLLGPTDPVPPEIAGRALVLVLLFMLLAVWVAVPFHRYFLCDRAPGLFSMPDSATGSYLLRSIWIGFLAGLLAAVVAIGPAIVLVMIFRDFPNAWLQIAFWVPMLLVMPVILRWSACLPGIAIGSKDAIEQGKHATARQYRNFLVLGFLTIGLSLLFDAAIVRIELPVLYYIASNWFPVLLNLSILTTLWGYFVEGRELH